MPLKYLDINDYESIIRLWNEVGLPIRPNGRDSYDNIKRQLDSGQVSILGYLEENNILGIVLLSHDYRKGWINRLAVKNNHKRRKIGSKLLSASEQHFIKLGIGIFVS